MKRTTELLGLAVRVTVPFIAFCAPCVHGQTGVTAKLPQSAYLTPTALPPDAQGYLKVLGNRLQVAGNERITLIGTTTDKRGTGTAQLVAQLPGNVRLDRQTAPGSALVYVVGTGVSNSSSLPQEDLDVLESLAADTHEAFLYGFTQQLGHRLLGARFRTDDGKTPDYQGPYYDIYEATGPNPAANNALRQKWYFFDSGTHLLVKTRYLVKRSGTDVAVESQYSNWTNQNGQQFPGQIVRTENGAAVFTFKVAKGAVGAAANDGLFSGH